MIEGHVFGLRARECCWNAAKSSAQLRKRALEKVRQDAFPFLFVLLLLPLRALQTKSNAPVRRAVLRLSPADTRDAVFVVRRGGRKRRRRCESMLLVLRLCRRCRWRSGSPLPTAVAAAAAAAPFVPVRLRDGPQVPQQRRDHQQQEGASEDALSPFIIRLVLLPLLGRRSEGRRRSRRCRRRRRT